MGKLNSLARDPVISTSAAYPAATYLAIFCMVSSESGDSVTSTAAAFPVNGEAAKASTTVYSRVLDILSRIDRRDAGLR